MVKHTDSVCGFYYLLVKLIFVLERIEETFTLEAWKFAERVEGNTRNKLYLVFQRLLVRDKLQENIACFTWS